MDDSFIDRAIERAELITLKSVLVMLTHGSKDTVMAALIDLIKELEAKNVEIR